MQLTKQTDFAFRTLLFLGQQDSNDLVRVQDVCDYYNISANHISKVVMKLVKLGYVEAVRGKGGGIRLGKPAIEINLADVVEAFETSMKPVNCTRPRCRIVTNCKLKGLLSAAMQAFMEALKSYTLQDLLKNPHTNLIANG